MSVTLETFDDQVCLACENEGHFDPVEIFAKIDRSIVTEYAVGPNDHEYYAIGPGRCERGHTISQTRIEELLEEE